MPDPAPIDRNALRAIAGTVRQRLNLPYAIEVCELDPLVVGFALLDARGALRATAMVSRTNEMCEHALLVALAEEIGHVLNLCAQCSAEADVQRDADGVVIDCRRCGQVRLTADQARACWTARATGGAANPR